MRILVTAGSTRTPIDRVRVLTNVFTGRTGAGIAAEARRRGHDVALLTSHPDTITGGGVEIVAYSTFDDLHREMAARIPAGGFDAVLHSAAVSDYALEGVFAAGKAGELRDVAAGKVKSTHAELWLKLVPTPKLVDFVREPWGFRGVLVKFKLEVGLTGDQLLAAAAKSRAASDADLIVANTLDGAAVEAFLGGRDGSFERFERSHLAATLLDRVERLQAGGRADG